GDGAEPFLVIGRRQVLLRRHPLDRVPELVEVVDAVADQGAVEREHVRLPVGVEGGLVGLLLDRREALHASDVVDPAHGSSPRSAALPPTYSVAGRRVRGLARCPRRSLPTVLGMIPLGSAWA